MHSVILYPNLSTMIPVNGARIAEQPSITLEIRPASVDVNPYLIPMNSFVIL